jgi:hypothetical protein
MRNAQLERLDQLVGWWATTMSDAWFLEPTGATVRGATDVEWLGESFVVVRTRFEGDERAHNEMTFVIGYNDSDDAYVVLYHDDRGVCRQFAMTFDAGHWTLTREDPDSHQRFVADVELDRILGRWEASEDAGATWRKDFDLTFERA